MIDSFKKTKNNKKGQKGQIKYKYLLSDSNSRNIKKMYKSSINSEDIKIHNKKSNNFGDEKKIYQVKKKEKKDENIIEKIIKVIPKKKRYKYFDEEELNSLEYKYAIEIFINIINLY